MPRLITEISCTWSVMETVQAFLRVSKLAKKGQFERYSIRYLPKFISVNELKQYFLENYSEELSPASNCTSLTIGYMSDGRRKCDIKTEKQLDDAYRSVKNGWITLWVDPHSSFKRKQGEIERREAGKAKRKRNSGMNGKPYCLSFPLVTKLLNV